MKEKVSIIMPAYNSEKSIKEAINSILKISYENIEIIIINDNSTDGTDYICKEIVKKYEGKIKYYINPKKGVSSARNLGLEKAESKYVMFFDSDDLWYSENIDKILNKVNEEHFIIFGYDRNMVGLDRVHTTTDIEIVYDQCDFKKMIERFQKKCLFNQLWNKIYDLEIIKINNIRFDENKLVGEDFIFNIEYMEYINESKFIDEIGYRYNSTRNGLNFKYIPKRLNIKLDNLKSQEHYYKKMNWDMEYIYIMYILTCISGIATIKSNDDKKISKAELLDFINNTEIHEKIKKIILKTKSAKTKILAKIVNIRSAIIINIFSDIFVYLKKIYRKVNIE